MYSNPYYSPENITAKAFIVYEHFKVGPPEKNAKYLLAAFNSKLSVEIASLTKIMTCILTIEIC
jgi:D-alanyl-D-alanine carboxypeptidase